MEDFCCMGTMWIGKKTIKSTKGKECGDPTDCKRE